MCTALGIEKKDRCCAEKTVCEVEDMDRFIESGGTHREVTAKSPVIIIKEKAEVTCILRYVVIPSGTNVTQKKAKKKLKYNSLCTK